jgi:hypothetical protein
MPSNRHVQFSVYQKKGEVKLSLSPFLSNQHTSVLLISLLFQILDGILDPVHSFFDVLHADGIGETGKAVITESHARDQRHLGIYQQV